MSSFFYFRAAPFFVSNVSGLGLNFFFFFFADEDLDRQRLTVCDRFKKKSYLVKFAKNYVTTVITSDVWHIISTKLN